MSGTRPEIFFAPLRARFKSEWGLERNRFLGCVINSSVRLEIGSGRSGNGVRCLEPGQKFRIFNSDHFPFFKNLNPTSGSRVSLAGNWVWTIWKRSEVSGTRPEISFAPFGRSLRVNGGWRETDFWHVCSTVL